MRIFQTNLGRSRLAQDVLFQTIRDSMVSLAMVSKLYRILDAPVRHYFSVRLTFVPLLHTLLTILLILAFLLSSLFSQIILAKFIFLHQPWNLVQMSSFLTMFTIKLFVVSGVPT